MSQSKKQFAVEVWKGSKTKLHLLQWLQLRNLTPIITGPFLVITINLVDTLETSVSALHGYPEWDRLFGNHKPNERLSSYKI